MTSSLATDTFPERWRLWLLAHNRRGTRTLLWIVLALYPAFGVLDYVLAPRSAWPVLWGTRALVTLATLVMFALLNRRLFARWGDLLSAGYMVICALGISVITIFLGGLDSPYYAGLTLAMVATGLLFVRPPRMVLIVHAGIVASFIVPNLLLHGVAVSATAASNLFFLIATALIASVGQILMFRGAREQQRSHLINEETTQGLEYAHQQLQQIDRLKSQFFANITHELRTPITMILAPLEHLMSGDCGPLTATQRSYLEANRRNGIRLLKLINDLLDLAKLEEGFLRLRAERNDLRQMLEDVLAYARPLAARKNLTLDLDIRSTSADLYVDVEKMERVIVNLLSNALKFTESGGVTISMERAEREVRIAVEDSGIGIAAEYVERTFDRFSQEDTSITRRYGGTGIGLAYAKEIVELHGGLVTVSSKPGQGSRFVVHLPEGDRLPEEVRERRLLPEPARRLKRQEDKEPREWAQGLQRQLDYRFAEIEQVTDRRPVPRAEGLPGQAARVLVVEDNVEIRELISLHLGARYQVYLATDGRQGLELARRERPDLIVTDYMMPEMDGLTMLRQVREDPGLAEIPVVMLSARSQLPDRLAAREAGADVYLAKPFSPRELEAVMRQLLGKQGRHIQDIMRAHAEGLEIISAGLAHEIYNPLNFIKNAHLVIADNVARLQEALPHGLPAERTEVIDKARHRIERMVGSAGRGVERIEKVVEMIRRYAREGFPTEPSDVSFDEAVREVTALVAPQGEMHSTPEDRRGDPGIHPTPEDRRGDPGMEVAVTTDLRAEGLAVRAIAEELNQVIRSLIQNAIEAVGPGGQVRVKTRAAEGQILFEVSDNGPGIEAERLARIFSPFYTTKVGSGRGLGLAIVQVVVARLGGSVEVGSVPGVETTFRVRLSAVPLATPEEEVVVPGAPLRPAESQPLPA
jgi:signal transduction histidine kinase